MILKLIHFKIHLSLISGLYFERSTVYPNPATDESAVELHKPEKEQPILMVLSGEIAYVKVTEHILLNKNSTVQRKFARLAENSA